MADAPTEAPKRTRRRLFWPGGLSARLLVLTVVFAGLGGALAIPPALASFEKQWLLDRVRAAELASLAAEVAPDRVVSEQLKTQLLEGAGVEIVAVSSDGVRRLVFANARPARAPYLVDLRDRAADRPPLKKLVRMLSFSALVSMRPIGSSIRALFTAL